MEKSYSVSVILERADISLSGHDLGIWDALTKNLPADVDQVQVLLVRKYA